MSRSRFVVLLLGILHRPRATLERLAELPRRPWRRMALLIIAAAILPVVATYTITSRQTAVALDPALSSQQPTTVRAVPMAPVKGGMVRVGPGGADMPSGEDLPSPELSPVTGLVLPALGRLGSLVLNWLLWSAVLYVIGTMMGARNTFGHMLHMVIWTWVPFAVRGVLQAGYIWIVREPITHQGLSGLVASEALSTGMPTATGTGTVVWQTLLGQVDIYLFWHLALVAVGLVAMARLPRRKAVILALGSWAFLTLLSLLPAVIGGSIAGLRMG